MKAYIIDRNRVFESLKNLENFGEKDKVVQAGLRKASRILIKEGKRGFLSKHKKKTGNLYRSLSYLIYRKKLGSIVGFKKAGITSKAAGNHAHLIDRGTKKRTTLKGNNRGYVKGSSFFTHAVDQSETSVFNTLYETIEESILRLMKR